MKKNSFLEGSFIATASIVFVKILGMLYVIPFYSIVGPQGASLYAYAYTIYNIFLDIASAGLPIAISKLINEYNTLGKNEAKVRAYKIGMKIVGILSFVSFFVVFVFARFIAQAIIGDLSGGNTIESVTLVIRAISFSILVIPYLSVSKGYLQGHNYIKPSSVSQVLEQIVRIVILIGGSFVAIKILKLDVSMGVAISLLGALAGGIVAYLYIQSKLNKNKKQLGLIKYKEKDDIENKEIVKKIFSYAIPLIIIDTAVSIYQFIDMVLIIRTLDYLGFAASDVELISSSIVTYAPKINMIIASISTGVSVSLIPTIVSAHVKKDWDDVSDKLNKALQMILIISIPMAVGISLLSKPIWALFYDTNMYGPLILALSIFTAILINLFVITSSVLQGLNKFKTVYITTILGFVTNAVLDVPLMLLFNKLGLPAYHGAIVATIIGYSLTILLTLFILNKQENIHYDKTIKLILKSFIPLIVMGITVCLLKMIIPFNIESKISCIIYIGINALVGAIIYLYIAYKMEILQDIFGIRFLNKIIRKVTLGKINLEK